MPHTSAFIEEADWFCLDGPLHKCSFITQQENTLKTETKIQ